MLCQINSKKTDPFYLEKNRYICFDRYMYMKVDAERVLLVSFVILFSYVKKIKVIVIFSYYILTI